jgi:hypothetical protein
MEIKVRNDETVRTITFQVDGGPVLDSWANQYSSRAKRFRVERGRIYLVGDEIRNVSVGGPLVKKDGSQSDVTQDEARWSTRDLDKLPDWLAVMTTEAVHQVAREWVLNADEPEQQP